MIGFFIFLIGISIGSFMNVCIYRIPLGESLVSRSHCKKCSYVLKVHDLVPVFSYIFLKGKCRSCGEKISFHYLMIELINGILYLLLYMKYGLTLTFVKYIIIGSILIVLALIDFNTQYVYIIVSWSAIILSVIFVIIHVFNNEDVSSYIFAAIVGVIVFGGVNLISKIIYKKQGLGEGDVEVILSMGLTLGLSNFILSFLLAMTMGAIVCIIALGFKKIQRKDYVPFVPFLAMGAFITMLFGGDIIRIFMESIIP